MNFSENAKTLVVEAGKLLQKKELVVRTWGNISVRTDASNFFITPTGARYEVLEVEDVVQVSLDTLAWRGKKQPSSELLLHAKIYKYFPKVSFILHTHQQWGSLLTLLCYGKMGYVPVQSAWVNLFGTAFPSAEYAEAGTEQIAQSLLDAIVACYKKTECSALCEFPLLRLEDRESGIALMAHHGIVVYAQDMETAFALAQRAEDYAKSFILERLQILNIQDNVFYNYDVTDAITPLDIFLKSASCSGNDNSESAISTKLRKVLYALQDFCFCDTAFSSCYANSCGTKESSSIFFATCKESQVLSYLVNLKDWNKIGNVPPSCKADGKSRKGIGAYFDDVAQIAGSFFRILNIEDLENDTISNINLIFKEASILIIEGEGLLLLAPSKEEACNMIRLFEKNTYAFLLSLTDENIAPLPLHNAKNLHEGYITSYSKRAEQ